MKSLKVFLLAIAIILPIVNGATATLFNFYDIDTGGETTATIDFSISGNTLVTTIENTSPIDLVGGESGGNSPGITGFGFNLDPAMGIFSSWDLTAYTDTHDLMTIGSNSVGSWDWVLDTGTVLGNFSFNYIPNTFSSIDGALFNPDALFDPNNTIPGGSNDVYFTTAVFTMIFDSEITGDVINAGIRMQNVGINGEGSTKTPGAPVPEPATMLLIGSGLLSLAALRRKTFNI